MSFESETLTYRRRLRRHLSLWRAAAIVAFAVLLIVLLQRPDASLAFPRAHVARLEVSGIIAEDAERDERLLALAEDDRVKALILRIDSPGGTTAGSEALFRSLREVAAHKPVVAVMGGMATSGGYVAAVAADHIVAQGNTITGSIGVIFQTVDVSELLDSLGVEVEQIASGPLKGVPNPFQPMSPEARRALAALVADAYDWFVGLVAERRDLPLDRVRALADGRVYSGRQALAAGLIDAIGDERAARIWLEEVRRVPADLPVRDVGGDAGGSLLDWFLGGAADAVIGKVLPKERLMVDGLVSVWHPGPQP